MTTKPGKTRKSAGYHHGDLKRALVDAGRRVLEEQGADKLSLRGVARAAGVSQAAPYPPFADKDALLAAIATQGFAGLAAEMAARSQHATTSSEHMAGLGEGYIVFAFRNPELFRLMHGPRFEVGERYTDLLTVASESYGMLRDGVAACLPGAGDADIDSACKAAWSLVHGASMLLVDGRIDVGRTLGDVVAFANDMTRQLPVSL